MCIRDSVCPPNRGERSTRMTVSVFSSLPSRFPRRSEFHTRTRKHVRLSLLNAQASHSPSSTRFTFLTSVPFKTIFTSFSLRARLNRQLVPVFFQCKSRIISYNVITYHIQPISVPFVVGLGDKFYRVYCSRDTSTQVQYAWPRKTTDHARHNATRRSTINDILITVDLTNGGRINKKSKVVS